MTSILMIVVNQNLVPVTKAHQVCLLQRAMFALVIRFLLALRSIIEARASREEDILILRQQLLVLHRKWRTRLRLRNIDRLILVSLYRLFPSSLYLRTESRYFDLMFRLTVAAELDTRWALRRIPSICTVVSTQPQRAVVSNSMALF
jgi:hypothetical protein